MYHSASKSSASISSSNVSEFNYSRFSAQQQGELIIAQQAKMLEYKITIQTMEDDLKRKHKKQLKSLERQTKNKLIEDKQKALQQLQIAQQNQTEYLEIYIKQLKRKMQKQLLEIKNDFIRKNYKQKSKINRHLQQQEGKNVSKSSINSCYIDPNLSQIRSRNQRTDSVLSQSIIQQAQEKPNKTENQRLNQDLTAKSYPNKQYNAEMTEYTTVSPSYFNPTQQQIEESIFYDSNEPQKTQQQMEIDRLRIELNNANRANENFRSNLKQSEQKLNGYKSKLQAQNRKRQYANEKEKVADQQEQKPAENKPFLKKQSKDKQNQSQKTSSKPGVVNNNSSTNHIKGKNVSSFSGIGNVTHNYNDDKSESKKKKNKYDVPNIIKISQPQPQIKLNENQESQVKIKNESVQKVQNNEQKIKQQKIEEKIQGKLQQVTEEKLEENPPSTKQLVPGTVQNNNNSQNTFNGQNINVHSGVGDQTNNHVSHNHISINNENRNQNGDSQDQQQEQIDQSLLERERKKQRQREIQEQLERRQLMQLKQMQGGNGQKKIEDEKHKGKYDDFDHDNDSDQPDNSDNDTGQHQLPDHHPSYQQDNDDDWVQSPDYGQSMWQQHYEFFHQEDSYNHFNDSQ